jgi:hypothetical protein
MCHDNRFLKPKNKEKKEKKPCSCQCEGRRGKKEAEILKRKPPIKLNGILII